MACTVTLACMRIKDELAKVVDLPEDDEPTRAANAELRKRVDHLVQNYQNEAALINLALTSCSPAQRKQLFTHINKMVEQANQIDVLAVRDLVIRGIRISAEKRQAAKKICYAAIAAGLVLGVGIGLLHLPAGILVGASAIIAAIIGYNLASGPLPLEKAIAQQEKLLKEFRAALANEKTREATLAKLDGRLSTNGLDDLTHLGKQCWHCQEDFEPFLPKGSPESAAHYGGPNCAKHPVHRKCLTKLQARFPLICPLCGEHPKQA